MRREIKDVRYSHEGGRSGMTLDVVVSGVTETRLEAEWLLVGGSAAVTIVDEWGRDGVTALMGNEDICEEEALGVIASVLSDLEKADRLNRAARQGMTDHVLRRMAGGGAL